MATREDIIQNDETTEMLFKDDAAKKLWDERVEKSSDSLYGSGVVDYARYWAKYMQTLLIAEGKTVSEVAKQASDDADIDGVTGNMYVEAVQYLSDSWKYGEELRQWHNQKYGYDGDGVFDMAKGKIAVG